MDKIAMVKKEIQLQNWSDKEIARQESGLTVTEWCRQEGISTNTYYYRLRKIKESLCERVSVLRKKQHEDESTCLGRRWISSALQKARQRTISLAAN